MLSQADNSNCPDIRCQHAFVMKLHSESALDAKEEAREEEYQKRRAGWERQPVGLRSKTEPRRKNASVQEYICSCYLLNCGGQDNGGNCPNCMIAGVRMVQDPKGRPGALVSDCPVCRCMCSIGPFKDTERASIYLASEMEAQETQPSGSSAMGPPTEESTMSKFGSVLNQCMQVGETDLRHANSVRNMSSVQGATAGNLSQFQFPDDAETNHFRGILGQAANRFPDGSHPADHKKKGSRFYRNGLANSGSRPSLVRHACVVLFYVLM